VKTSIDWMVRAYGADPRQAHAGAVAYLKMWGLAVGGWQMGRAALVVADELAAGKGDAAFQRAKITTACFYVESLLPQALAFAHSIEHGGESALALADEAF